MNVLDKTAWEVLNATADDCENFEQIYRLICYELFPDAEAPNHLPYHLRPVHNPILLSEIANRIRELVDEGLLAIVMDEDGHPWQNRDDLSYVWRAWFSMTAEGKSAWESSAFLDEEIQRTQHKG
jgi:hypothetical protein